LRSKLECQRFLPSFQPVYPRISVFCTREAPGAHQISLKATSKTSDPMADRVSQSDRHE